MNNYKNYLFSKKFLPAFFTFVLIILIFYNAYSQSADNKVVDGIRFEKPHRITFVDSIKTLYTADLFKESPIPKQRTEPMLLYPKLLQKKGKYNEAIERAYCALENAIFVEDYEWQTQIYLFISKQYKAIDSSAQERKYLMKSFSASDKITSETRRNYFKSLIHQEMAFWAIHKEKYRTAITYLKQAVSFYKLIEYRYTNKTLQQTNYELLGKSHLSLKDYDAALNYYHQAEQLIRYSPNTSPDLQANLYLSLAGAYIKKENYEEAEQYLMQALSLKNHFKGKHILCKIYKCLADYYKLQENKNQYEYFLKLYKKNADNLNKTHQQNTPYCSKGYANFLNSSNKAIIYRIGGIGILCIAIGLLIYYRHKFYFPTETFAQNEALQKPKVITDKTRSIAITNKTEKSLVLKIEKFEKSSNYLNKEITLTSLAHIFNTNTRYLSMVIKTHRNKKISDYLNGLRINYAVKKIIDDPLYRKYKISYLAKEFGYNSSQVFVRAFKKETGVTPSYFIKK